MEQALEKIRPHTSSSLAHQKRPATLLVALESTFREQKKEFSPTAYFAALCTTLDGTVSSGSNEAEVLHAELYLLALVAPFVPTPVIQANLTTLLSLTAPLFPLLDIHAPALRSQLSIYHIILKALDRVQLEVQGVRQAFATILKLCIDQRPKVRKKSSEIVKDVLAAPPAPLARHPYAEKVAEWVRNTLTQISTGPFSRSKSRRDQSTQEVETGIHAIAFLRPILLNLPPSCIPSITDLLLTLPRFGNPYLSQSVYSILSDLFSIAAEDSSYISDHLSQVFQVILSSSPLKTDVILSPAWIQLLGNAFLLHHTTVEDNYENELGNTWQVLWGYLESPDPRTRRAAADSLANLCRSFHSQFLIAVIRDRDSKTVLHKIITQATKALDSLVYAKSLPELLAIVAALVTGLQFREEPESPTAAELLLLPTITRVGHLRTSEGFEHKEEADRTLASAMRVLGPAVVLRILPLNVEDDARQAGQDPRAYLLPMLRHPHPSPLQHFASYFVPLSERMFDRQSTAEAEGRQAEAKVWGVLVLQIWTGLVGYCWGIRDLKEALTPSFSQLLSRLLYGQPELRPAVLQALKTMVESNVAIASPDDLKTTNPSSITAAEASQNLEFLRSQAENWLAVLFNVFSTVGSGDRGVIGDVISAWVSITDEQQISKSYHQVLELFKTNLSSSKNSTTRNFDSGRASVAAMTQDILILLLPYLHSSDAASLFQFIITSDVLESQDNGVQKRGYKILTKLAESGKFSLDAEAVIRQLDELSDGHAVAAKKDRLQLLSTLISLLPSSAMHVIPSLIPEAVLGTKEPSEKARTAAFGLVLSMAKKMNEGGVVKRNLVYGMDEESESQASASVEEFLTMLAGGLAASPHMISATVTAISRVLFEFNDIISRKMHSEIFTTMLVFLTSTNREIVKSILGYVKLAIHVLQVEVIAPQLADLVPALLSWSHDHKNHFKIKVRHIFERMIRRFGLDAISFHAKGEDAAKVLVNIKKAKDRAKRKKAQKAQADDDDDDDDVPNVKLGTGDAFEDILYGAESEDDEDENTQPERGMGLRMDNEDPLDLLEGAASRTTSATNRRWRKPGQDASLFKTDEGTGKIIIDESISPEDDGNHSEGDMVAGMAYREAMTSVDGFVRGPGGKIKFNKNTKKRKREAEEAEDVEMADYEKSRTESKTAIKKKADLKPGHKFKAKKAGGDIKKKGIDPYAYVTLSQAAQRQGRGKRTKLGIAGKR